MTIAHVSAISTHLNPDRRHRASNQSITEFPRDGRFCHSRSNMTGRDFNCVNQHFTQSSNPIHFQIGERQTQPNDVFRHAACSLKARIADDFATSAKILNQRAVRLKPFSLFQLKSEAECFAFKQLCGINSIRGKQSRVIGDKKTGLASFGHAPRRISSGSEPGDVRVILQQKCIGSGCSQQRTHSGMLFIHVCQALLIQDQTSTTHCVIRLACAHGDYSLSLVTSWNVECSASDCSHRNLCIKTIVPRAISPPFDSPEFKRAESSFLVVRVFGWQRSYVRWAFMSVAWP